MRSPDTVSHSAVSVFCAPSVQRLQSSLYHYNTKVSGEYNIKCQRMHCRALKIEGLTAHRQRGWQPRLPCYPQGSLIWRRRRKEQGPLHLFCPVGSDWQTGGNRWWRKEHPYKTEKQERWPPQALLQLVVKTIARCVLPEQGGTKAFVQPSNALFPQ